MPRITDFECYFLRIAINSETVIIKISNPFHLCQLIEHTVNAMPQSQSHIIHYDATIVANAHNHNVEQKEASILPYIMNLMWPSLRDSLVNLTGTFIESRNGTYRLLHNNVNMMNIPLHVKKLWTVSAAFGALTFLLHSDHCAVCWRC